jgi:hypothetical protein
LVDYSSRIVAFRIVVGLLMQPILSKATLIPSMKAANPKQQGQQQ